MPDIASAPATPIQERKMTTNPASFTAGYVRSTYRLIVEQHRLLGHFYQFYQGYRLE